MSVFKKVPALDWLKDFAEGLADTAEENGDDKLLQVAFRLDHAYRYLLWSLRYQQSPPQSDEHAVALGMVTKYHRKLYQIPPTPHEKNKIIPEAEALRKRMLADAKKVKTQ